jgi:hypothetical protein
MTRVMAEDICPWNPSRLLKNVASGLQPGAPGAQEPECTEGST